MNTYLNSPLVENSETNENIRSSVFNLCSATLGCGILSIPLVFAYNGIVLGIVLLLFSCIFTYYSIIFFIDAREFTNILSFSHLVKSILGNKTRIFIELNIFIFCFSSIVAYNKIISDLIKPLLEKVNLQMNANISNIILILIWILILFPLTLIENLSNLKFTSMIGVINVCFLVLVITYTGFDLPKLLDRDISWIEINLSHNIQSIPIMMYAFSCQLNIFSIYDDLKKPNYYQIHKIIVYSLAICYFLYLFTGLFSYLHFKKNIKGNILLNFNYHNPLIIITYISVLISILFAYPLIVFPCSELVKSYKLSKLKTYFLVQVFALIVSLYVPTVNIIFQLAGGTSSCLVCFCLSPLLTLKLGILDKTNKRIAYIVLVSGCLLGFVSTYLTIKNL